MNLEKLHQSENFVKFTKKKFRNLKKFMNLQKSSCILIKSSRIWKRFIDFEKKFKNLKNIVDFEKIVINLNFVVDFYIHTFEKHYEFEKNVDLNIFMQLKKVRCFEKGKQI